MMKFSIPEIIYLFLTITLLLFGFWGIHTVSGRKVFDEMAGIIPMKLGKGLGGFLLILWIGYRMYHYFK